MYAKGRPGHDASTVRQSNAKFGSRLLPRSHQRARACTAFSREDVRIGHVSFSGKQHRSRRRMVASSSPTLASEDGWDPSRGQRPEQETPAEALTLQPEIDGAEELSAFQKFWQRYNSLLERKPILTKSLTSLFGFAIGDILAQLITGQVYTPLRTLRLTLFGIFMDGPVGHLWYTTLDKTVYPDKPKAKRAVVTKTLLDQLLWAPSFTCVFFTFMCCLEGRPHMILKSIQQKLLKVMLTNYAVWPLAHLINFRFVPTSQRILYINACQVARVKYCSKLPHFWRFSYS